MTDRPPGPGLTTRELLEQQIRANRARLIGGVVAGPSLAVQPSPEVRERLDAELGAARQRARAAAGGDITPEQLAALQAEASARAGDGGGQPAGAAPGPKKLPLGRVGAAVRSVLGGRVLNPKVHELDVARAPVPEQVVPTEWLHHVGRAADARGHGDPLRSLIVAVGRAIAAAPRGRISFAAIAEHGRMCFESVRKGVRFLEDAELLDTFNVLTRIGNALQRGVNLYLRRLPPGVAAGGVAASGPAAAPAEPEAAPELRQATRFEQRLRRWAAALGLVERPWGLNATPLTRPIVPS